MTGAAELDLKHRLAMLSERDRRAISAYLLRLKHQSKQGRRQVSRLMREMDCGKKTKLSTIAADLRHA